MAMNEPSRSDARVGQPTSWTRIGWVLTALVSLFLLADAVIHIMKIDAVVESFEELGYPLSQAVLIGVAELVCVVIYLVPKSSVLGGVLLSGYLGGAMSAQMRIEAPLFSTLFFPLYLGLLLWAGLWLRDPAVRAVLPLRLTDRSAGG